MVQSKSTTNKRTFKHLTAFDRGKIAAMRNAGKSLQAIADEIGCHKSTICRELKRGTATQMRADLTYYQAYFPETGQIRYEKNRQNCGAKLKLDTAIDFIKYAEKKILDEDWSPDALCGEAKRLGTFSGKIVCTKTLYNYIERGIIRVKNIDLPMKVRLKAKTKRVRKNKRILGRSIDERHANIENRQEFGHWEIDTVLGKKSGDEALMTLTERRTRKEFLFRISGKNTESINEMIQHLQESYGPKFPLVFKSITADNGSEFAELNQILKETDVFFTHPYSSFERGTNERHNGLIRRFIPKGKAIVTVSDETISYAENWCNHIPRKILGYKSPEECFQEEISRLAS